MTPMPAPARWLIELACSRRSIRWGFAEQDIDENIIDDIIRCGLAAPSSKNAQPWRLHVVTARHVLTAFADAVQHAKYADTYVPVDPRTGRSREDWPSTVAESAEVLRSVPLGIFVENLGEFGRGREALATTSKDMLAAALVGYTFEVIGLGAAVQNMWLAAHAHGLAGVFMGDVVIAEETIRQELGMRGDFVGVLALGRTSAPPPSQRFFEEDRVVRHE